MLIYVGLRQYNYETLNLLLDDERINGVVLGDGFCNKRMFPHGDYDLLKYIEQADNRKKAIFYQTPCFLTDNKLNRQLQILDFLKSCRNVWVLVQDLGMAYLIGRKYPELKLCWSRLGKFRVDILNADFINSLSKLKVGYMEIEDENKVEKLVANGVIPCFMYGKVSYQSFGRICYSCYETDTPVSGCERICLTKQYSIRDTQFLNEISLNGFVLGEKYSVSIEEKEKAVDMVKSNPSSEILIGIYGKNLQDVEYKIDSWKEMFRL